MDVVVQFAIHRLGFQPQDIVIYAWSIGGFTGICLPYSSLRSRDGHRHGWLPRRGWMEAFRERGWKLIRPT
jgi:hypothetical protein